LSRETTGHPLRSVGSKGDCVADRLIEVAFDGALASLTLQRPPQNLLSIEFLEHREPRWSDG
jgi:hypothetical protein